jgi:hypothetical protein
MIKLSSLKFPTIRDYLSEEDFTASVTAFDEAARATYEDIWVREIEARRYQPGVSRSDSDEWDWTEIASVYMTYAVWRGRKAELLALISLREDGAFEPGQWMTDPQRPDLAPALYVEYLDTSPLMQKRLLRSDEERPYSTLLPTLLQLSEQLSTAKGYGGRILLHALQGAEKAYRREGLIDIGMERFDGKNYLLMRNTLGWS